MMEYKREYVVENASSLLEADILFNIVDEDYKDMELCYTEEESDEG